MLPFTWRVPVVVEGQPSRTDLSLFCHIRETWKASPRLPATCGKQQGSGCRTNTLEIRTAVFTVMLFKDLVVVAVIELLYRAKAG